MVNWDMTMGILMTVIFRVTGNDQLKHPNDHGNGNGGNYDAGDGIGNNHSL